MKIKPNLKYLLNLSKNTFFDEFKTIDKTTHKVEFKDTGTAGEQYTYRAIWYYFKENLFRNVYVRRENGKLTEIDLVGVGKKGIYVFESKNWDGHIYADGNRGKWLLYNQGVKKFVNSPIGQNLVHIKALRYHLNKVPADRFFSVIIFSTRCKIDVKNIPENVVVVKRDSNDNIALDRALKTFSDKYEILSDEEVGKICSFMRKAQRPDKKIRDEHLEAVRKGRA